MERHRFMFCYVLVYVFNECHPSDKRQEFLPWSHTPTVTHCSHRATHCSHRATDCSHRVVTCPHSAIDFSHRAIGAYIACIGPWIAHIGAHISCIGPCMALLTLPHRATHNLAGGHIDLPLPRLDAVPGLTEPHLFEHKLADPFLDPAALSDRRQMTST